MIDRYIERVGVGERNEALSKLDHKLGLAMKRAGIFGFNLFDPDETAEHYRKLQEKLEGEKDQGLPVDDGAHLPDAEGETDRPPATGSRDGGDGG